MTTDDSILIGYMEQDPKNLKLVVGLFSFEPYGIAEAKGNTSLQRAVDDALATIGNDGEYGALYRRWFHRSPPRDWRTWYGMSPERAAALYREDQP